MAEEIQLFPVAEWDIATIPAYDAIFIRFGFLSHATQRPAECDPGRRYLLNRAQAHELVAAIQRTLQKLESAGFQRPPTNG